MRRGGHVLLLVMILVAAFLAVAAGFFVRLEASALGRRESAVRLQALWLARSAAAARREGTRTVETHLGPARLTVRREGGGLRATASLAGAEAQVTHDAQGFVAERVELPPPGAAQPR